jgi:hypothetical protein
MILNLTKFVGVPLERCCCWLGVPAPVGPLSSARSNFSLSFTSDFLSRKFDFIFQKNKFQILLSFFCATFFAPPIAPPAA